MNVVVSRKAEKVLHSIADAKLAERIESKLRQLEHHPHVSNVQKLQGYGDLYRARVGDFRIVYRVERTTIHVEAIGHRKEIYR